MSSWAQFQAADPALAAEVKGAFAVAKHCTMATIRADGGPRISGTEVEFADDGDVYLGMGMDTRKAQDLRRDPRVGVHSPTRDPAEDGSWVGEAKLNGRVVQAETPPGYPPGGIRLRIDLTSAVYTGLSEDRSQLRIRLWRPDRGTQTMLRS